MASDSASIDSLCTLVVDCPHSTPKWTDSGFVVLRNQNIKSGRLDTSSPSYTDAKHFADRIRRAKPSIGDIVITREAPMGEVCMVPAGLECCLGQRQVLLRPDPKRIDPRFMFYALQSPPVQHQIGWSEGTGSTVSNLRIPVLKALSIPTPSRDMQEHAADLLGALDDRIELLRETNATLEAIAKLLFKSWFVDFDPVRAKAEGRDPEGLDAATAALFPSAFEASELGLIPKGWRAGRLGELCQNIRSQAKPDALDSSTPYVGLEHMPRGSIALTAAGTADGLASGKFWYARNDVLFGKLRPYFHKVGVASHTGVCSTDILVIRANDQSWFGYTTMQLSSAAIIAYATRLSNGAKMPRSSWSDISSYKIVIPPKSLAGVFDALVRGFVDRIHSNIETMSSLASLRDTLLPRLISGKLRLPEAAIEDALT